MQAEIIDVHSHVQFPVYDADREVVIKRAKEAGVKMLAVGTQASISEAAIKLAHQYPNDIWATVGYHPNHLSKQWYHDHKEQSEAVPEKFDIGRLRHLAKDPKVAAIGECGLDYFRLTTNDQRLTTIKNLQKEVFLEQVELAQELEKPLMIHCRPAKGTDDAYLDLLALIPNSQFLIPKIVHFYVGSLEITKKLVAAGFYFTFGGVITFARDYDEAIKYIPLDRILLETDCPYVAPASHRGKRNEPAYIVETASKMAELKNLDLISLASRISDNALKVFSL
ncbi:MAG: TatD family hydrolase [Candidatus Harrisonbacteria bacterium]|nr:TatD family hydrolase [Candidatus Harrisonbacteria bacterium]